MTPKNERRKRYAILLRVSVIDLFITKKTENWFVNRVNFLGFFAPFNTLSGVGIWY